MALELKAVVEMLGIDVADLDKATIEDLKKKHDERFITLDEAHTNPDIMKKANGSFGFEVEDTIFKSFKDLGIEKSEFKALPSTKEKIQFIAKKQADKIAELTDAAGKGNDEKVLKLTKDLEKIQGQANQYKSELEKTAGELETEKTNFTTKLKGFKVQNIMKDAKAKLAWSDQANDLSKRGFDSLLSDKYVVEIADDDSVSILDKKGQKIPHSKKTGTFLTIDEVLDLELDTAGLKKKNNLDGGKKFVMPNLGGEGGEGVKTRPIAPAAQAALNKVK